MTFSNRITSFLYNLHAPQFSVELQVLNPYIEEEVKKIVSEFYTKYYSDSKDRVFIIGINPGRFGGGVTGLSFTDPVALRENCGIENNFGNTKELSSRFIYSIVERYGGASQFFSKFYLTALYPLPIIKNGKNYNFYDDKELYDTLYPSIITSLQSQIIAGARRDVAICLGKKNFTFLNKINKAYNLFEEIKVLEHPRYILQYKSKYLQQYIDQYLEILINI